MKLTVQVKLLADTAQASVLNQTMRQANAACNWLSQKAWDQKVFAQFALHKSTYHACRNAFPELSSQVIVRANAKVADAYKLDRKRLRIFKPLGAITYDCRILSWKIDASTVSIWTVDGRQTIPFVCGDRQRALLQFDRGEVDLVHRDGRYYLFLSVDVPDAQEGLVADWLGVDLGVVEIAATSDGQRFAGAQLNKRRARNFRLRKRLQSKGTRSARRLLRKRRRKESRFSSDVNHSIAKQLVNTAKRTGRGIALENLKGIRGRIRATRNVRRRLHSWAFADLANKIGYKAKLTGVKVCFVDPRNTSRTCPICGHISKGNRKSRDTFKCQQCGYKAHADTNGAQNIRRKAIGLSAAEVNQPYAPGNEVETVAKHNRTSMEPDVASLSL